MYADLNLIGRPRPLRRLNAAQRSSRPLTPAETRFLHERGWLDSHITDAEEQFLRENGLGLR
jgi:hypothetical protein